MKTNVMKVALAAVFLGLLGSPALANERLVVTGGTLTEIVFALDGGDQVVAVDSSSMYPASARQKPNVGYYRELAAEGVLAQRPTELWVLEGSGSAQTLRQIAATGVEIRSFAKPTTVTGLYDLITDVGQALANQAGAEQLVSQIAAELPSSPASSQGTGLFLLQASERGIVVAGHSTVPALLFEHAGVNNLASHQGFKPMTLEFLAMQQPDLLVAPEHVVQAVGGPTAFCALPSLQLLAAARDCRLLVLDSLLALGMTPRLPQAIAALTDFANER